MSVTYQAEKFVIRKSRRAWRKGGGGVKKAAAPICCPYRCVGSIWTTSGGTPMCRQVTYFTYSLIRAELKGKANSFYYWASEYEFFSHYESWFHKADIEITGLSTVNLPLIQRLTQCTGSTRKVAFMFFEKVNPTLHVSISMMRRHDPFVKIRQLTVV